MELATKDAVVSHPQAPVNGVDDATMEHCGTRARPRRHRPAERPDTPPRAWR